MINKFIYGKIKKQKIKKALYNEFLNDNECDAWGRSIYKEWAKKYEKIMHSLNGIALSNAPIECYCGYTYQQINNYLRTGIDEHSLNKYREMTQLIVYAMVNAPRVPCNLIAYRLVSDEFIKEMINRNRILSKSIKEKGFMSVSLVKTSLLEQNEAYSDYINLLKIYLKKNQIGFYTNSIESTTRGEKELLLAPGLYLRMIEYPYKDKDSGKVIYECELLTSDYE